MPVLGLVVQTVKNLSAIWVRSLGQRSPVEGNGYPLQYSCLENPTGRRTSWTPQGSKESDTTERLTLSPPSPPKETLFPHLSLPSPPQPLTDPLCLRICLFWKLHVHGITHPVPLGSGFLTEHPPPRWVQAKRVTLLILSYGSRAPFTDTLCSADPFSHWRAVSAFCPLWRRLL